jgi:hypothetical protein
MQPPFNYFKNKSIRGRLGTVRENVKILLGFYCNQPLNTFSIVPGLGSLLGVIPILRQYFHTSMRPQRLVPKGYPFSVLNFFQEKQFGNYWFESGSPSFLVRLIHSYRIDLPELAHYKVGEEVFSSFDINRMHVVSLLFQTGYLTIKEILPAGKRKRFYILSYPNLEVKEALLKRYEEVKLIGVGFDPERRNLGEYQIEDLPH